MDQTPLLEKFDRVAKLRKVSQRYLGVLAVKNGRAHERLASGSMTIKAAQKLDAALTRIENALLEDRAA